MEVNPRNRKFFTVELTDEFLKRPRIPSDFASDWKGKSRGFCRLKAADYQKSARVCMKRKQGDYYLTHGWRKVVQRLKLVQGNFVSFFLIPPRTFEVLPVPLTHHQTSLPPEDSVPGCSAKRHSSLGGCRAGKILKQEQEEEEGSGKNSSFESILKSYHMSYMILPMAFARETGIIYQENAVLTDEDGKDWPVKVKLRELRGSVCRVDLTQGWSSFRTANNFCVGKALRFKFHESTGTIHVKGLTPATSAQSEDSAPDHCPKSSSSQRGPRDREILEQEGSGDNSSFRVCLKQYHMFFMDLPEAFAGETGTMDQESVVLTDEVGKDWTVKVATRRPGSGCRVELWWSSLRRANKFVVGEILEFKFDNSTAKIHVKKIQK